VEDAQQRLSLLTQKNNFRVPSKWFDNDIDAEKFAKAVARTHDRSIHRVGRESTRSSLCRLLDAVSKHRGLRIRNKGDPPRMSLRERCDRHWQAVIDDSSLARDLNSQRLVRHVTLTLVSAHFAFGDSTGPMNENNILNDKICKVSEWFAEDDPEDVKAFEALQPKRPHWSAPKLKGMLF
jgi:hypothetical protein